MSTSHLDPNDPQQQLYRAWEASLEGAAVSAVTFERDEIRFDLRDGRKLIVPLEWFPRLRHATVAERKNYKFVADGRIIEWPDLDEGEEVQHLLLGWKGGESERSFKRWLEERKRAGKKA
jgi:hypothetical protein